MLSSAVYAQDENPKSISSSLKNIQRWRSILINLPKIKIGDSIDTVKALLGEPDLAKFCPRGKVQYLVDNDQRPKGEDGKYIIITLNDMDKIISIDRSDWFYGPPPDEVIK